MRIGLMSYFKNNELEVAREDPDGYEEESFSAEIRPENLLYEYYKPFANFLDSGEKAVEIRSVRGRTYITKYEEEADLWVGMSRTAHRTESDLTVEMTIANLSPRLSDDSPENIAIGRDGIYVELGSSWTSDRMIESEPES